MEKYSRYIGRGKKQISKMQAQYESIFEKQNTQCVHICTCMLAQENSRRIFTKVLAGSLFGW